MYCIIYLSSVAPASSVSEVERKTTSETKEAHVENCKH